MAFFCYITFPTTFYAIQAEKFLKDQGYSFKMIPVPRVISSSCGTSLRCSCDLIEEMRSSLLEKGLELEAYYRLEEVGLKTPQVEELLFDDK